MQAKLVRIRTCSGRVRRVCHMGSARVRVRGVCSAARGANSAGAHVFQRLIVLAQPAVAGGAVRVEDMGGSEADGGGKVDDGLVVVAR